MQTRRKILNVCIAGALLSLVGIAPSRAAEPTVAGFWEAYDDGKPGGWFLFFERDGMFQGALVKAFNKPGESPQLTCAKCTDERKDAPMIGLSIVKGMQRKGLAYENGTILDPRNGSVYNAQMTLSPDSKTLGVRGYLGIPMLGQTQTWKRLPDNSMAATELPEDLRQYVTAAVPPAKPANGAKPAPSPAAAGTTRPATGTQQHPAGTARNTPAGAAPNPQPQSQQQPPQLRRQQQN